jgi:tRNA dimethylallyltransferase
MAATVEIAAAHEADAVPIVVGGTGLYLRTLLDGIAPVPQIDPAVRDGVRALDPAEARAALVREDPARAARLAPNDRSRIVRALEVVRSTGRSLDQWQAERSGGIGASVALHPVVLLPARSKLYQRCDRRFAAMAANGALDEVAALRARRLDPTLPVMRAIGVRELQAVLQGEASMDEAVAHGAQATRNYAKRQYTWFRHQVPDWPVAREIPPDPATIFEILLRNKMLT